MNIYITDSRIGVDVSDKPGFDGWDDSVRLGIHTVTCGRIGVRIDIC
jgi:hypothetical protein